MVSFGDVQEAEVSFLEEEDTDPSEVCVVTSLNSNEEFVATAT